MGRLVLSYWLPCVSVCVCARVRLCACIGGTGCLAVQGGRRADRAAAEEEEAQREKEQQGGSPNTVAERREVESFNI